MKLSVVSICRFFCAKRNFYVLICAFFIFIVSGTLAPIHSLGAVTTKPEIPSQEIIENAPQIMRGEWDLIDPQTIYRFVFAPLPEIVEELAQKAPVLKEVLDKLGIDRLSALWKAKDVDVPIPGFQETDEITTDLLYAQDVATGLDLRVHIVFDEEHFLVPRIKTLPQRATLLLVKPSVRVENVTGFLTLKPKPLTPDTIDEADNAAKEILDQFTFNDPDQDGIFSAEFVTPAESESYNLSVAYKRTQGSDLSSLKMTLVVLPPGIVYEKIAGQEKIVPQTQIALFAIDPLTGQEDLWDSSIYKQENPQLTNTNGEYSFLAPAGKYRFRIKAKHFEDFVGPEFVVTEAQVLNERIMLERKPFWRFILEVKQGIISLFTF